VTVAPLPQHDAREGRDRLEILTALISAPSFDPLFRGDIITIPAGHPVYRWDCLAEGCERAAGGNDDLCHAHKSLWQRYRDEGGTRAGFLREAPQLGPGAGTRERPCRICPDRPASHVTLELCEYHENRWHGRHFRGGRAGSFGDFLAAQDPLPGYGGCLVRVCPEMADSPLGLCFAHGGSYRRQGSPGGAALPGRRRNRYECRGRPVPVACADERAFRRWCEAEPAVPRPAQVNLRGLNPLVRAEVQWGMHACTRRAAGTQSAGRAWRASPARTATRR
jgi:hypothetical protein